MAGGQRTSSHDRSLAPRDDRATSRYAVDGHPGERRPMHRVTIAGHRPTDRRRRDARRASSAGCPPRAQPHADLELAGQVGWVESVRRAGLEVGRGGEAVAGGRQPLVQDPGKAALQVTTDVRDREQPGEHGVAPVVRGRPAACRRARRPVTPRRCRPGSRSDATPPRRYECTARRCRRRAARGSRASGRGSAATAPAWRRRPAEPRGGLAETTGPQATHRRVTGHGAEQTGEVERRRAPPPPRPGSPAPPAAPPASRWPLAAAASPRPLPIVPASPEPAPASLPRLRTLPATRVAVHG